MHDHITVPTADAMRSLGRRLAGQLRAGDLVILGGPLGAGKTTLVQGIADGLGVRGPVTSPTFVIARVHPALSGGPDLVHADAYRLASPAEVDDLDLDTSLDQSVTVVEWGGGLAEGLAADRLEVTIEPAATPPATPPAAGPGARGAGETAAPGPGGPAPAAPTPAAAPVPAAPDPGDATQLDRVPRHVTVAGHGRRWQNAADSSFLVRLAGPEAV